MFTASLVSARNNIIELHARFDHGWCATLQLVNACPSQDSTWALVAISAKLPVPLASSTGSLNPSSSFGLNSLEPLPPGKGHGMGH